MYNAKIKHLAIYVTMVYAALMEQVSTSYFLSLINSIPQWNAKIGNSVLHMNLDYAKEYNF